MLYIPEPWTRVALLPGKPQIGDAIDLTIGKDPPKMIVVETSVSEGLPLYVGKMKERPDEGQLRMWGWEPAEPTRKGRDELI